MNLLKIEQLFQNEDDLTQILNECKEEFDKVDNYGKLLKQNTINTSITVSQALVELTGVFMLLKTVLAIAETEKKNREVQYYDNLRIEAGSNGTKFVDGTSKQQSSAYVSKYRRIRNYIAAYVDSIKVALNILQSTLKHLDEDRKFQTQTNISLQPTLKEISNNIQLTSGEL